MSDMKDGGPAFPLPEWSNIPWPKGTPSDYGTGMSIRDWFAGQALAGFCSSDRYGDQPPAALSAMAYDQADCMLIRRARSVTAKVEG